MQHIIIAVLTTAIHSNKTQCNVCDTLFGFWNVMKYPGSCSKLRDVQGDENKHLLVSYLIVYSRTPQPLYRMFRLLIGQNVSLHSTHSGFALGV